MLKKYIITGAPGTGKSTLIKSMQSKGVLCAEEVSRDIIKNEQLLQSDGMPWDNMERFCQLVFKETMHRFKTQEDIQICDRSLLDIVAYLNHVNLHVFDKLSQFNFHKYYHNTVFFAAPWEAIYQTDPQRPENFKTQLALSKTIEKVYSSYGFTLCYLPRVTVAERTSIIMEKCSFLERKK